MILVEAEDAKEMARRAAREEGMLVGISSGATLAAIQQKLPELPDNARVLGFNYDTGERYLSVPDFLPEELNLSLTPFLGDPVNMGQVNLMHVDTARVLRMYCGRSLGSDAQIKVRQDY